MDKKLIRNIILAFLAIALLGGTYYFVLKWEPEPETGQASEKAEQIIVFETDTENILSLEISNESGVYTIEKINDYYTISGMENADLLTDELTSAVKNLTKITAKRILNDAEKNLADFGLETPSATLKINNNDGSEYIIKIGNEAPTGDGRYAMTNASPTVYLVSDYSVDYYLKSAESYKNTVIAALDTSAIKAFEIYKGDECITKIREKNASDTLKNDAVNSLVMETPYYEYVPLENLSALFKNITEIKAIRVIEDDQNNAAKYGIGKYTIKFTDNAASHVLKLGYTYKTGEIYAVYEGKNAIYAIDETFLKLAEGFEPFDYISKFVQLYNIDEISKVEYISPRGSFILEIDRTDAKNPVYTVNGQETEDTRLKTAYQSIIGIMFTSKASAPPDEKIGSVTFTFNDGSSDTAEYFQQGERNYIVIKSDGTAYCILKKNFDKVFDDIKDCITL